MGRFLGQQVADSVNVTAFEGIREQAGCREAPIGHSRWSRAIVGDTVASEVDAATGQRFECLQTSVSKPLSDTPRCAMVADPARGGIGLEYERNPPVRSLCRRAAWLSASSPIRDSVGDACCHVAGSPT